MPRVQAGLRWHMSDVQQTSQWLSPGAEARQVPSCAAVWREHAEAFSFLWKPPHLVILQNSVYSGPTTPSEKHLRD